MDTWQRGVGRVTALLPFAPDPGTHVLEAACGDGMTGALFALFGHQVMLTDLTDWRDPRSKHLPFIEGPLETATSLPSDHYDLVFSFNSFEHVRDPRACLQQLLRVCRPGGYVYLHFGPLYACPYGLHAYRTIPIPYAQYLFSEQFLAERLAEVGVDDCGGPRASLQPLNKWKAGDFRSLLAETGEELLEWRVSHRRDKLGWVFRYPECFGGRGLIPEDLTAVSIELRLRKRRSTAGDG